MGQFNTKKEYFNELKRVSSNQIIWGGNYFLDYLGATQGFLIWDKKQPHDFNDSYV
jgi:site-specific DNA-methyltransferase (adenine-specific)